MLPDLLAERRPGAFEERNLLGPLEFKEISFPDDEMNYITPSANQLNEVCFRLSGMILRSETEGRKRNIDAIVTLEKGGLTFVRTVADQLRVGDIYSFRLRLYTAAGERLDHPILEKPLCQPLHGQRILVFDETDETGASMEFAKAYLEFYSPAELVTALLFHKPHSRFVPDYYGTTTSAWIIFPHEHREGIADLCRRWQKQGVESAEMRKRFLLLELPETEVDYFMGLDFSHQ